MLLILVWYEDGYTLVAQHIDFLFHFDNLVGGDFEVYTGVYHAADAHSRCGADGPRRVTQNQPSLGAAGRNQPQSGTGGHGQRG